MLESFKKIFGGTKGNSSKSGETEEVWKALREKQFPEGSFFVFREEDVPMWHTNVSDAFPVIKGKFRLFGYDWIGNCFGISADQHTMGEVLIFEIGTGKILTTGKGFADFVNKELVQNIEACLALRSMSDFVASGGRVPCYGECIGYKVPMFLSGKHENANMEVSDMDVYWTLLSQIKNQIGV